MHVLRNMNECMFVLASVCCNHRVSVYWVKIAFSIVLALYLDFLEDCYMGVDSRVKERGTVSEYAFLKKD